MKKLIALTITGLMLLSPFSALADDDLEARVAALEDRVAALEAQLSGSAPEGVAAAPDQEPVEVGTVGTGIVAGGCSLEYVDYEVTKSYDDHDCVVLYFDFTNGSGETTSANMAFYMEVFQNGKEQEFAVVSNNQAYDDRDTDLRSGAEPLRIAFASEIEDMSDIIVNLSSSLDWNAEDIEFSLSLQ